MPRRLLGLLALVATASPHAARAQLPPATPYAAELRRHAYATLRRSPWRALGYELLAPGAGSAFVGVYAATVVSAAVSLAGASMWIAGARRDRDALRWTGIGVFAAGRAHGLISAPVSAAMLNAAFRRQLGFAATF